MQLYLSTAYLPTVEYIAAIRSAENVVIEKCENFIKQTYRTRTYIMGPNGVQMLAIPVVQTHDKILISDVRIDYSVPWQRSHWRSITTAYNGSPYFLYYQDFLKPFYEKRYDFLLDFNMDMLALLLKLLSIQTPVSLSQDFSHAAPQGTTDLRYSFHPKRPLPESLPSTEVYPQVFSDRFGFVPRLSVLDLLSNVGLQFSEFFACKR